MPENVDFHCKNFIKPSSADICAYTIEIKGYFQLEIIINVLVRGLVKVEFFFLNREKLTHPLVQFLRFFGNMKTTQKNKQKTQKNTQNFPHEIIIRVRA